MCHVNVGRIISLYEPSVKPHELYSVCLTVDEMYVKKIPLKVSPMPRKLVTKLVTMSWDAPNNFSLNYQVYPRT